MNDMSWAIAVLSVVGVVLNVKKLRAGFAVWSVTNGFWAVYDFSIGAYAQAALFTVYLGLALWGLWEWRKS